MAALNIDSHQLNKLLSGDKPVLVDYWAPWCSYCVRIGPAYDEIAERYGNQLEIVKVNIDEEPRLAEAEQIEVIPTLVLYRNGEAVGSIVAPESRAAIESFLSESISPPEKNAPDTVHDMIIIGGGPGGYTSALYAARAGLDTLVLEKLSAGGQMALTHQIDNYPGFAEGVDGFLLAENMQQQAERFGSETENAEVLHIDLRSDPKVIETSAGVRYGRTVVIATGANPRPLGLAEEPGLVGRGIAYCAACDGMFYRGRTVAVIGGGNTAAADALLLSRIAKKVIVIHRRDSLRATKVYHEPLMRAENVEFCWNSVVTGLLHEDRLTGLRLKNVLTGEETELPCDGAFVSIGRNPASALAAGQLELDDSGYIVADETTQTGIPGVYAVGDVRTKPLRQVVTAVSDGATAVHMAEQYLAGL